ncbi:caspase family protein [Peribacillus sp. NJ11]|uniref:caspase family protein n=1 Tax=Peribacillus sp. NJ11 TaxID=3055861 RepID=UPI0025A1C2B1|nr:caspase family protein [Peribacillus sp. NJ11]MDM5223535.1 caspase family protein [Peribacillus sp. NJ11]
MELIAKSLHYDNTNTLLTADATIDNVVNEVKKAALPLESGDIFFLSYSGHGGRVLINKMMKPTVLTKPGVYMMGNS